jgi:hypothetical protein
MENAIEYAWQKKAFDQIFKSQLFPIIFYWKDPGETGKTSQSFDL